MAYNHISRVEEKRPKDYNVCKGDTVALVTRLGSPESPGRILKHYPGCTRHATMAMSNLGATEKYAARDWKYWVFHSLIPLADARREIRQQELVDEAARTRRRDRRWWRRRR